MRTQFLTPALSFLMIWALSACGTTDETFPDTGAADVSADGTGGDVDSDTDQDTDQDAGEPDVSDLDAVDVDAPDLGPIDVGEPCDAPDPRVNCLSTGCEEGFSCVEDPDGCGAVSCYCNEFGWTCSPECGPSYVCVPDEPSVCPAAPPTGESCDVAGAHCEWGTECCCGTCSPSMVCDCVEGGWACYATDACFISSCEGRECQTDVDCEGGGIETSCVGGVCRKSLSDEWSEGPTIPLTIGDCDVTTDAFELTDLAVEEDTLLLTVAYSGGCAAHHFRVCWDEAFEEGAPVRARLSVQHDNGGDICEAYPSEVLEVSLEALSSAYRTRFGARAGAVELGVLDRTIRYAFR